MPESRRAAPCHRFSRVRLRGLGIAALLPLSVAATEIKRDFDLPAGDAEKSLQQFHAQSGVEVLYSSDAAAGVRTNAVKGRFSPQAAIELLLAGTSLTAQPSEKSGAFIVSRKPAGGGGRPDSPAVGPPPDSVKKKRSPNTSTPAIDETQDPARQIDCRPCACRRTLVIRPGRSVARGRGLRSAHRALGIPR